MMSLKSLATKAAASLVYAACFSTATQAAPLAKKIIAEGDPIGATTVDVLRFSGATNSHGGFAVQLDTADGLSHIYGNTDGVSPNAVLRSEGTIGGFTQTQFDGEIGLADSGALTYGATIDEVSGGMLGLDAVYQDDVLLVKEGDASANGSTIFIDIVSSRGGTPSFFGLNANNGLFVGAALNNSPAIGDNIATTNGGPFVTDGFLSVQHGNSDAVGSLVTGLINTGSSSNDGIVLLNGAPITTSLGDIREDDPIPASNGGFAGENWDNFDFLGINEAGDYLITGDTNGDSDTDEFVAINGVIIAREGDPIAGGIIDGSIENASLNAQGMWAAAWDYDTDLTGGGADLEAIYLGDASGVSRLLVKEGDLVDLGGMTATLDSITTGLVLGDLQSDSSFSVWFRGRVVGSDQEIQFVITIPEPTSLGLLGIVLSIAGMRRRM